MALTFSFLVSQAIFTKFRANMGGKLPTDFFTWLEILLGGESDLLMCDEASGYNYGAYFEKALLAAFGGDQDDVDKVRVLLPCLLALYHMIRRSHASLTHSRHPIYFPRVRSRFGTLDTQKKLKMALLAATPMLRRFVR